MIDQIVTSTAEKTGVVFHRDPSDPDVMTMDAVTAAPDFAEMLDSIEDRLREAIQSDRNVNLRDLAQNLVALSKRKLMGDILIQLLDLFGSSSNVKLDVEILIAASGLPLRDIPDCEVAKLHGLTRQAFSARKRALLKRLNMASPMHSKSEKAISEYRLTNRRNKNLSSKRETL